MSSSNQSTGSSYFDGFSKLPFDEKIARLQAFSHLSESDLKTLQGPGLGTGLTLHQAGKLVENVVGVFGLPYGVATHFLIDGKEMPIPMVVEETSVIAAASASAKWVRRHGGFSTKIRGQLIIGQIQFPFIRDPYAFASVVEHHRDDLVHQANQLVPSLVKRGGGVKTIQIRTLPRPDGQTMAVLHILCDPCDAMGANLINQICEGLKPTLESLTGESIGLCILSNLVDTKLFEAHCVIRDIDPGLGRAIEEATLFAQLDPYRAATHVKGIMNGIDPILLATGNDWRAVEAGVHSYAALPNVPRSLSQWTYSEGKGLEGTLVLPLAVGIVGGVTKIHPAAQISLRMMGVNKSDDLARICVAVGLAQNLGALRALCSEGIIHGHMRLHATNLALMAGATPEELPIIEAELRNEKSITLTRAKELLHELRHRGPLL